MKNMLSFKTTLRIALRGKWVIRAFTIFLCACCFASVALASTRFVYDKVRVYADIVYERYSEGSGYNSRFPYFGYQTDRESFTVGYSLMNGIPQRYVGMIEETTQLPFVYYYQGGNGFSVFSSLLAGAPIYYSLGEAAYTDELRLYESAQSGVCASPALLNELGYTVEAGRLPENAHEIAVTPAQFETFRQYNYSDNTHLMDAVLRQGAEEGYEYVHPDGAHVNADEYLLETYHHYGLFDTEGYWFRYDEEDPERRPKEELPIETYDDLLGKEVILYGDPEEGVITFAKYYKAKIVGIVEPPEGFYDADRSVIYWEGFQKKMVEGYPYVNRMITRFSSLQDAERSVEVTLDIFEDYLARFPDDGLKDFSTIGLDGLPDYAVQEVPRDLFFVYKSSGVLVGDIFIGLALFFGVISVILCWYLTTASLKFKEKAFGVLRSVGAGERCVRQIALTEIAFLAVCIFLLALVLTAGLYFGFLNAPSAVWYVAANAPHPTRFIFTGWTVLILAVLSFGVPLLCSIVPLRKFLKKSIVDNISGNIRAR